ncbi:MAG TPA: kynureninase [Pseudogracilibacillus sp.]|nr:kynureninase [Pseudogracilibacillus sp.]
MTENRWCQAYAQTMDEQDALKKFRKEFYLDPGAIYMDGNSLGLMSERADKTLEVLSESWKTLGINGWTQGTNPWFYLSDELSEKSTSLIGAKKEEVMITGSTTVNIHQLVASFFKPAGKRTKILADELNFPSDIYALKSQLTLHGLDPEDHLVQVKSRDGHTLQEADIIAQMTEEIAFILLPSVLYRSGQILDIERLTKAAHERGIVIAFDLCHSIGAIPHKLDEWGVDFAVWCTYKYLNGGPGSVAGLYVNQSHLGKKPGLAGWFSSDKEKQFDMDHTLTEADDAGAFQMGTPHVLSAAPLLGSLEMFEEIGVETIRSHSLEKTAYMMELIDRELKAFHFTMANPREDAKRGGHVFLVHDEAARICKALKANHVIPDFRAPNGIRLAPVALYNTFEDIWQTIQILKTIMKEEQYKEFSNKRDIVA